MLKNSLMVGKIMQRCFISKYMIFPVLHLIFFILCKGYQ